MAKHRSVIAIEHDSDQEARVTLAPPETESWFRLFRSIVRNGIWAELGPAARGVLIVLTEAVNDQIRRESGQWLAWPSVPTIAKRAGLADRNVYVGIKELEAKHLVRRMAPGGGRKQSTYELLAPKRIATSEADSPTLSLSSGVTKSSGVQRSSGVPGRVRQGSHDEQIRQQRQSVSRLNDSSIRAQLADAGIGEPVLSRLITENTEDELLLRFRDWKTRQKLGSKLGVAWLIASIQQKYELHDHTQREIDGENKAAVVKVNRVRALEKEAEAERALAEIDRQTRAMLGAMSDEELAHWKSVVIAEYPTLFRQPAKVDPATDKRLRTLILGKLAHLVAPDLADARDSVGPAQLR